MISPELYEFFRWYKCAVEEGNPCVTRYGLCTLLADWDYDEHEKTKLMGELSDELHRYALGVGSRVGTRSFPFNYDGWFGYQYEFHRRVAHLNPDRIAFVDRLMKEYEDGNNISRD